MQQRDSVLWGTIIYLGVRGFGIVLFTLEISRQEPLPYVGMPPIIQSARCLPWHRLPEFPEPEVHGSGMTNTISSLTVSTSS